jgi:hypothetical protein
MNCALRLHNSCSSRSLLRNSVTCSQAQKEYAFPGIIGYRTLALPSLLLVLLLPSSLLLIPVNRGQKKDRTCRLNLRVRRPTFSNRRIFFLTRHPCRLAMNCSKFGLYEPSDGPSAERSAAQRSAAQRNAFSSRSAATTIPTVGAASAFCPRECEARTCIVSYACNATERAMCTWKLGVITSSCCCRRRCRCCHRRNRHVIR